MLCSSEEHYLMGDRYLKSVEYARTLTKKRNYKIFIFCEVSAVKEFSFVKDLKSIRQGSNFKSTVD